MAKIYLIVFSILLASIVTTTTTASEEGGLQQQQPAVQYFTVADLLKNTSTTTPTPKPTCEEQGPQTSPFKCRGCNVCNSSNQNSNHRALLIINAIDGTEILWLSPSFKTGNKFQANITMDFDREYEVAYVFITMEITPRPAAWALERSTDFGVTWTPWQFFARNESECKRFFGDVEMNITKLDSVICETSFAPSDSAEIMVSLLNNRPLVNPDSLEWAKATNIRLRFFKMPEPELKGSPVKKQARYYPSLADLVSAMRMPIFVNLSQLLLMMI